MNNIKTILKKIIKTDGKSSNTVRKIAYLKTSKEFSYLIDTTRI
ncbi:MAG: hypothetical protein PHE73_05840 [Sulfurovaceae bacterium]|nr:hypothetical protein [Sulfurovaceae bacterium]